MADAKITQLTEDTSLDTAHVLPIVDVADTTMAASGTTKKTTLGTLSSWLASLTQTLTNKRITKRRVTVTSSATPSFNTDNGDIAEIALATTVTSMTTNLTGTPSAGDMKLWDITPTGTQSITWGASFTNTAQNTWPTSVSTRTMVLGYWSGSAWLCVDVKSL